MIHKNWAELIKPQQLDVKPGNEPARQATVIAEPLERGFGLTMGNALRRVLMSTASHPQVARVPSCALDKCQLPRCQMLGEVAVQQCSCTCS